MKFPRCIRLDGSDPNIYARAAEPGEWVVIERLARHFVENYVERSESASTVEAW